MQISKSQSMYQIIKETANKHANEPALYYEGHAISYKKMITEIDCLANNLVANGYKPGDTIAVCLPNMPQAVYAFYAINKIGAICYEIHPMTPKNQMKRFLQNTNSKLLFITNIYAYKYVEVIEELKVTMVTCNPFNNHSLAKAMVCEVKGSLKNLNIIKYAKLMKGPKTSGVSYNWPENATAVYLNSGGTTGEPKIIELSNFAINTLANNGIDILGITDPHGVYMLAVLPMFHGFGLCMGIHSPLMHGACATLMLKFNTSPTIKLIRKGKITILIGVPALYRALLKRPKFASKHLQKVTVAYVGGDFVPQELTEKFNQTMVAYGSQARLLEGYGLTETVTVCTVNTIQANRKGSVGKAVNHALVKVVDMETRQDLNAGELGEICVSGDILMNGYFQDEELNQKVFLIDDNNVKWVLTGDYGYIDQDDYFYFKQRLKRIIKVSGVIVCPSDVENVVSALPEIHNVYATSTNHDDRGSMIKLFVVKNHDCLLSDAQISEIIKNKIKEEVSVYALPKEIRYLEKMPLTEIGKIDGKALDQIE